MANPPIEEQPIYRPFTPPTPHAPNTNGNFSTGLVWAVLALFPCCGFNIFAIIAIVLAAIASGEYKRGEYEMATKHAKTSKTLTIIAIVSAIVVWIILLSTSTDVTKEANTPDQEQVQLDPIKEKQGSDYFNKQAAEPIDDLPQSKKDIKINIHPASDNSDQPIDVERIKALRKEMVEKQKKKLKDMGLINGNEPIPGENGPLLDEETRKKIKEEIEKRIRSRQQLQDTKPSPNE